MQIVAMFTAIEVWCGGELPGMLIAVAVHALLEFHLVKRAFASRNVTLETPQGGMLAFQWIRGRRVLLEPELSRFEAIDGVAG